jgi:predicted negative regulator of RcsB-dependent stress response
MSADSPDTPRPLAEIAHGPGAFEQFLDRNQKNLMILGILGVLGIAGVVVYRGIEQSKETTAGAAFNKADDLASLQGVVKNHNGTTAAGSAMLLLATRQWTEGQQDTAIETLRSFLTQYPTHAGRHTARASLGAKLMAQGKNAEANEILSQLSDDPEARFLAPYGLITRGDIAKAAGDTKLAESLYQQARDEYPESNFADTATRRISLLKAKPPVEIEPPPAPTPAPGSETTPGSELGIPSSEDDVPAVTNPFIVEPTPTAPPVEGESPTPPPSEAPPSEAPPSEAPPAEAPPSEAPPAEAPPAENPAENPAPEQP